MSIYIYKEYVIEIVVLDKYGERNYVGDIYYEGDLIWSSHLNPAEAGALSMCIYYIDNLRGKADE